jgi:hypothetical protein
VLDLAEAGYIVKEKSGRRNRYQIQADLPLPEPGTRERTVGDVLALLGGGDPRPPISPDASSEHRSGESTSRDGVR